jgi:membrane protein
MIQGVCVMIHGVGLSVRSVRPSALWTRLNMNYRTIWSMFRQTFSAWDEHEAPRLSAALAFYTILSLAPLVILVVAIVALILGHSTGQNQLLGQVESMIGH